MFLGQRFLLFQFQNRWHLCIKSNLIYLLEIQFGGSKKGTFL